MARKERLLFSGSGKLQSFANSPLGLKQLKKYKITRREKTITGGWALFGFKK